MIYFQISEFWRLILLREKAVTYVLGGFPRQLYSAYSQLGATAQFLIRALKCGTSSKR